MFKNLKIRSELFFVETTRRSNILNKTLFKLKTFSKFLVFKLTRTCCSSIQWKAKSPSMKSPQSAERSQNFLDLNSRIRTNSPSRM